MKQLSSKLRSPFQRVLFATKCSADYEGTLQATFNFCQANKANLRILHICKTDASPRGESSSSNDHKCGIDASADERACDRAGASTVRASWSGEFLQRRLLQAIETDQISLVVLGTSELRGSKRGAFGPTAEQIMRKSNCPVMTVGPVAGIWFRCRLPQGR